MEKRNLEIRQILGISGIVTLIAGQLIPIAKLDEGLISTIPVWHNLDLYNGMYEWRDISFFAVTLLLLAAVSVWLIFKKRFKGLIFTGSLALFSAFIIFTAIFIIQAKLLVSNTITFSAGWGWLFLITGAVLLIISGKMKMS